MSITADIKQAIGELMLSNINGCITGSCMLDEDFDSWDQAPDIDVFTYSENSMIHAMCVLESMGYKPGGKDKTEAGETLKRKWLLEDGIQKSAPLSTIMYHKGDVCVNVTTKRNNHSVVEVLANFDMSIIMKGYDIPTGYLCDLRSQDGNDPMVAVPNKLKRSLYDHPSRFEVWRALRQWNRVIKYWSRGFDTRPMAEFYLDCIDKTLEAGAVFGTDKDIQSFEEMAPEFREMRDVIAKWLKEHEED